jgi:hypothetical protein
VVVLITIYSHQGVGTSLLNGRSVHSPTPLTRLPTDVSHPNLPTATRTVQRSPDDGKEQPEERIAGNGYFRLDLYVRRTECLEGSNCR